MKRSDINFKIKKAFSSFLNKKGIQGLKQLVREIKEQKQDVIFYKICRETAESELSNAILDIYTKFSNQNYLYGKIRSYFFTNDYAISYLLSSEVKKYIFASRKKWDKKVNKYSEAVIFYSQEVA